MKYIVDHDLHIHSVLSVCSNDPDQNNERILRYAVENDFKTVCVTDHFWDETVEGVSEWYSSQNYEHLAKAKPLPQGDGVKFLFGCETELRWDLTLGISEHIDKFDFIVIPTTHFHAGAFTMAPEDVTDAASRAQAWVKRLDAVLEMNLPFHKIGIAHLTCGLIAPKREEYLQTLTLIPEKRMKILFEKAAQLGVGIELNAGSALTYTPDEADIVLRPYILAKQAGCKFYCGSDAHHPEKFLHSKAIFEKTVDLLGLEEKDKFVLC